MKRFFSIILVLCLLVLSSCGDTPADNDTTANAETTSVPDDTTDAPETTEEPVPETTEVPAGPVVPEYVNALTGLPATKEIASTRPAAIILNNIRVACPQDGISGADVIFECLAEGGITRLMMLTSDYASLGVVGSVRSARDYFVDFSRDFDAILVHAGGSPDAYTTISAGKIDNIDFVNGFNVDPYFYRDEWRINNMGYVHSVVTTGSRLVNAFANKKIRTTVSPTYENMFNFVDFDSEYIPTDGTVNKISIPHSIVQTSSFVYDPERTVYDHYQFDGELHTDRLNGEKVSTENVILLYMNENLIPDDPAFRINVENVGSGTGVYLYGGKYVSIKWSRPNASDQMKLTFADGTPLLINRGKTFVSIVDSLIVNQITVE